MKAVSCGNSPDQARSSSVSLSGRARVTVGAGAYTGSGSVITRDVAPDALALERSAQVEKPGWAARFRAAKLAKKAKK